MIPSLEELRAQILVAPHPDMEPHVQRGTFLLLAGSQDLAETAHRMAANDSVFVSRLLDSELLGKVSASDIEAWRLEKRFFKFIIIQPFVIAQYFDPAQDPAPADFN